MEHCVKKKITRISFSKACKKSRIDLQFRFTSDNDVICFPGAQSESYTDLTHNEFPDISHTPRIPNDNADDSKTQADEKPANNRSHRYENITYKKQLLRRRRTKHSQADEQKAKERAILVQAEEHLKQTIEKELSFAKSNSLALPSKDSSGKKRGEKKPNTSTVSPSNDSTDPVSCTPAPVTSRSIVPVTSRTSCATPKSPLHNHTVTQDLTVTI